MSKNPTKHSVTEKAANKQPTDKKWEKVAETANLEEILAESAKPLADEGSDALSLPSHEELIAKINELEANQDKMVRLLAEKENSIRRANGELEKASKFAVTKLTQELLAVLDSLELSLQAMDAEAESLKSFREGIEMTLKLLLSTVEKYGVKSVNPINKPFDPNYHEAISVQENNEVEAGIVLNVLQKGYTLHERLIRPAMVIVAKKA